MFRRPDYSVQVLNALAQCRGIENWRVVFRIDPWTKETTEELTRLCRQFRACPSRLIVAPGRQGCNLNIKATIDEAFSEADFVACVEDDIVVAPDSLQFFEWGRKLYQDNLKVFSIGLWRHPKGWLPTSKSPSLPAGSGSATVLGDHFFCWGWATWRNRWDWMRRWIPDQCGGVVSQSWDCCVGRSRAKGNKSQLLPMVSRAINIGATRGTHARAHIPPYWAGTPGFPFPPAFDLPK